MNVVRIAMTRGVMTFSLQHKKGSSKNIQISREPFSCHMACFWCLYICICSAANPWQVLMQDSANNFRAGRCML